MQVEKKKKTKRKKEKQKKQACGWKGGPHTPFGPPNDQGYITVDQPREKFYGRFAEHAGGADVVLNLAFVVASLWAMRFGYCFWDGFGGHTSEQKPV